MKIKRSILVKNILTLSRILNYKWKDVVNYYKYLKDRYEDYQLYEFYCNYKNDLKVEDKNRIVSLLKKGKFSL